jgi:diadenosine tetraphosphate (Ap4A) HIT family hydrolase
MPYDPNNAFAKILRGEIPSKKLYEDEFALAFHDIHPQAPTHVLVIPKGPYVTQDDFTTSASVEEIVGFERAVSKAIQNAGLSATGYRLISNSGANGHQEVPHYHVHILGGKPLGPMLVKQE